MFILQKRIFPWELRESQKFFNRKFNHLLRKICQFFPRDNHRKSNSQKKLKAQCACHGQKSPIRENNFSLLIKHFTHKKKLKNIFFYLKMEKLKFSCSNFYHTSHTLNSLFAYPLLFEICANFYYFCTKKK